MRFGAKNITGGVCMALYIGCAFISLLWCVLNLREVPEYGDTAEYLNLAESLAIDQYRTIGYPLFLRSVRAIADGLHTSINNPLYLFQIAFSFAACLALMGVLVRKAIPNRRFWIGIGAFVLALNPLVAHFNLTILTDSLSSSLCLLVVALSIRLIRDEETCGWTAPNALFLTAAVIATPLIRGEKMQVLAVFGASLMAVVFFESGSTASTRLRFINAWKIGRAFLIGLVVAAGIRNATTSYDPARPPLTMTTCVFNRVAWPNLEHNHAKLPRALQQVVTLEDARQFDLHANHVFPFIISSLKRTPDGSELTTITNVILRNDTWTVLSRTAWDFTKYTIPNITFPLEVVGVVKQSPATGWTVSRFAMFTPGLARTALALSFISFAASLLWLASACTRERWKIRTWTFSSLWSPVPLFVVANAAAFALAFGMDAHIRYALPAYTLFQGWVLAKMLEQLSKEGTDHP